MAREVSRPALTQLTHAAPLQDAEAGHLLAYLGTVPDPRAGRGRRHPLVAILAMAAAALRHHSRDPYRPLATLGISLGFA